MPVFKKVQLTDAELRGNDVLCYSRTDCDAAGTAKKLVPLFKKGQETAEDAALGILDIPAFVSRTRKITERISRTLADCSPAVLQPDAVSGHKPSVRVSVEGNVVHYVLDSLLPPCMRSEKAHASAVKEPLADLDDVCAGYLASVAAFGSASGSQLPWFSGGALLLFVHYYGDGPEYDHDNLDCKPFIDCCVSRVVVPDDSPRFLDMLHAGVPAGKLPHTEAYVGPKTDVVGIYAGIMCS